MAELAQVPPLDGILCDIDDTLTHHGRLVPGALEALARAQRAGLKVIPVTGRPGGWVDHIARMWPVDGVVGENGGLWFWREDGEAGAQLHRRFLQDPATRATNRARLELLGEEILAAVPGTALASDQPYRELDLAIDFCEDVPALGDDAIDAIVSCFEAAGATCKVSSIHVNGWFGRFDKLAGIRALHRDRWGTDIDVDRWAFFGDSANDAPMFGAFPLSIGVANVRAFLPRMDTGPAWITDGEGGHGFVEAMDRLLG
ncbi:MAG: HAD family phosphatase [Alphaproteobacteria bacterium]|nr:HAD family phosphatase [Alphaproteobacteria bacterium]